MAASLPAEPTRAALAAFDAARLAVLLCEQQAAPGSPRAGPGVQSLLALARAALAQPGADAAGLGLLEGVLTLQPAAYAAAVLQIGLACEAGGARAAVLGMLCRVPTDLLPPPVLADALIQLAEALDGSQLAPPFLPYDLLGRLYRSAPVMQSLRLAVERGPDAAAAAAAEAAAARGSDEAWTVRIGGQGEAADAGADAAAAAAPEGAAGSSSTAQLAPPELPRGAAAEAARGLLLLPLQASSEPLAALLQRLVGALLSCLLRRAGSALDATSTGEELLQLLEALLMPAAEEGPWLLQWLWAFLFQVRGRRCLWCVLGPAARRAAPESGCMGTPMPMNPSLCFSASAGGAAAVSGRRGGRAGGRRRRRGPVSRLPLLLGLAALGQGGLGHGGLGLGGKHAWRPGRGAT